MPPRRPSLVYVGIKGHVVALNRITGDIIWKTELKGGSFVQVARDQEFLYATARGELWCINPGDGQVLWQNNLKGMGMDLASITSDAPMLPVSEVGQSATTAMRQRQAAGTAAAT